MLSVNRRLTLDALREILFSTAADEVGPPEQDPPGHDVHMGHGRIDAREAVLATPPLLPPAVHEVDPPEGVVSQTTVVTLRGERFHAPAMVYFGEEPADWVEVLSDTELVVGAPRFDQLGTVDILVVTVDGEARAERAFSSIPRFEAVAAPRRGGTFRLYGLGAANGDWGVVIDWAAGPARHRGLTWKIAFQDPVVIHNSFHAQSPPLNGGGQGFASFQIPDDPDLVGRLLFAQAVFDGNGPEPKRRLVMSDLVSVRILP